MLQKLSVLFTVDGLHGAPWRYQPISPNTSRPQAVDACSAYFVVVQRQRGRAVTQTPYPSYRSRSRC
jgi:hypothetical protein